MTTTTHELTGRIRFLARYMETRADFKGDDEIVELGALCDERGWRWFYARHDRCTIVDLATQQEVEWR